MPSPAKNLDPFAKRRHTMVERTILRRGVPSPLVLTAMHAVRASVSCPGTARTAYDDRALPIGEGQTMSQPYIVALMIDAWDWWVARARLKWVPVPDIRRPYSRRLPGRLSVERFGQLSSKAARTLAGLGCSNVHVLHGDGISVGPMIPPPPPSS